MEENKQNISLSNFTTMMILLLIIIAVIIVLIVVHNYVKYPIDINRVNDFNKQDYLIKGCISSCNFMNLSFEKWNYCINRCKYEFINIKCGDYYCIIYENETNISEVKWN